MGGTETIYEQMTKRLFRRNYLGCVVDRDVAGAQATRDFDVVRLGKVRHAVEVTSSQIEEGRRARDDWDKLRNTDLGLGVAWSLSAHEERRVRRDGPEIAKLLNQLEGLGVEKFWDTDPPTGTASDPVVERLVQLGITTASQAPWLSPPRLYFGGWGSGSLHPDQFTEALEEAANESGNRSKLGRAPDGARRHLVVWINFTNWKAASPLQFVDGSFDPRAPQSPPEIDELWGVIGEGENWTRIAVARSSGGPWRTQEYTLTKPSCLVPLSYLRRVRG
jgi:hypothetical protein